jgi:hypothetical protein
LITARPGRANKYRVQNDCPEYQPEKNPSEIPVQVEINHWHARAGRAGVGRIPMFEIRSDCPDSEYRTNPSEIPGCDKQSSYISESIYYYFLTNHSMACRPMMQQRIQVILFSIFFSVFMRIICNYLQLLCFYFDYFCSFDTIIFYYFYSVKTTIVPMLLPIIPFRLFSLRFLE